MRGTRPSFFALVCSIALAGESTLYGEIPIGAEFQVPQSTAGGQALPSVDLDAEGDFVTTWSAEDGSDRGVFGRLFDSSGSPVTGEFLVNSTTTGDQAYPSVAVAPDGSFVVVWNSKESGPSPAYGMVQRFDSSGAKLGIELKIAADSQYYPRVAKANSGAYIVVWTEIHGSADVFGARFDASGQLLATEFQVNVYTTSNQAAPSVAVDGDGDFVVTWTSLGQDGNSFGIFSRRFDSSGQTMGADIQVNTYITGNQNIGRPAMRSNGEFVVTWTSPSDGDGNGVFARRFDSSGAAVGGEIQVNVTTTNSQTRPVPMMDQSGGFVVTWDDGSALDGASFGVFARRFDATGTPRTPEFQVNTYTLGYQGGPAAAISGGRFVVAWRSDGQDGDGNGVFAQRFLALTSDFDVDGNGLIEPLTDGLLILRYMFGFRGDVLIEDAVGPGCTRCDAPEIEAFIAANL